MSSNYDERQVYRQYWAFRRSFFAIFSGLFVIALADLSNTLPTWLTLVNAVQFLTFLERQFFQFMPSGMTLTFHREKKGKDSGYIVWDA